MFPVIQPLLQVTRLDFTNNFIFFLGNIFSEKIKHKFFINFNKINWDSVVKPLLQPSRLYSPHTVFLRQSGNSFEIATALCSLLIGLGYDAYVVSGYAVRDITLKIMTRVDSPFPQDTGEVRKMSLLKACFFFSMKILLGRSSWRRNYWSKVCT